MLNPIHLKRATNSPELTELVTALLSYAWRSEALVLKRVNITLASPVASTPVQAVIMAVTLPPEEANFLLESLRGLLGQADPPQELDP